MQQEYITARGRVVLERDTLFLKTQIPSLSHTVAFRLLPFGWPLLLSIHLLSGEMDPKGMVRLIALIVLTLAHLPQMFDVLFKRSFSNRIPLKRIKGFELLETSRLEVNVKLQLRSGRYRCITFRRLENQYQPFTEMLSSFVSQPLAA